MNESKNILFLLITLTLVISCGSGGNDENGGNDAPGSSCTPNPNGKYLIVTLRPQKEDNWCWAASGQMVMEKLGTTATQCDQANRQFERGDCCPASRPDACDSTGFPEFGEYDFTFDRTDGRALSWTNVKKQIDCEKSPFCATWKWNGRGGHMVVITGYKIQEGVKKVKVLDPLPVNHGATRWITYTDYVRGENYTHWDDFYNIKKN